MVRNRDKRIAILLIAAFAWLFIGSLIVFHQEHVFGKHLRLNIQVFISPKYKDKQALTLKLQQPVKTIVDLASSAVNSKIDIDVFYAVCLLELKFFEVSSFADDILPACTGLRAPPTA